MKEQIFKDPLVDEFTRDIHHLTRLLDISTATELESYHGFDSIILATLLLECAFTESGDFETFVGMEMTRKQFKELVFDCFKEVQFELDLDDIELKYGELEELPEHGKQVVFSMLFDITFNGDRVVINELSLLGIILSAFWAREHGVID